MAMEITSPLNQLKVLDLSTVLAGPSVAMFLAELGAEVIKVENKILGGDVTRNWKLEAEKNNSISAYYASVNLGKQILQLNLKDPADFEIVSKLISSSDILITNFRKQKAEQLQLSFEQVKKLNPAIIHANISGYGEDSERAAFDVVLQAETGFMWMNGYPDQLPAKLPVAWIDVLAAHQLKEGILLALLKREREKTGYYVCVSLYDAALSSLVNQASNYLMAGEIPGRMGTLHPNIAPYGEIVSCKDQEFIVLAIGNDQQFLRFATILEMDPSEIDNYFKDNLLRLQNRTELFSIISQKMKQKSSEEWMHVFIESDIPAGKLKNLKEVFEDDKSQQLIVRSFIEDQPIQIVTSKAFHIYESK